MTASVFVFARPQKTVIKIGRREFATSCEVCLFAWDEDTRRVERERDKVIKNDEIL